jgi:3-hydroxy-9,10-secoandrosta-1,3,5(10)-triene-9,17-dione monooxygenase reductase component
VPGQAHSESRLDRVPQSRLGSPIDYYVDAGASRAVMGHFASGVVVLAGMTDQGPVGMSCQSFFSLSLEPPMIAISPSRASTTWPRLLETASFAVSILTREQEPLCRGFAVSGGDKFAGVGWSPTEVTRSPVIDGALAWIDCRIGPIHEVGDHYFVVGHVVGLGAAAGEPLLFYRGQFGTYQSRSPADP